MEGKLLTFFSEYSDYFKAYVVRFKSKCPCGKVNKHGEKVNNGLTLLKCVRSCDGCGKDYLISHIIE